MRSLQRAVRGTHSPGFYGRESEFTVVVCLDAREAQEAGRGRIPWKNLPRVTASRIGLPDFEHSVGDRVCISIEDLAANGDPLAGCALGHENFSFEVRHSQMKKGTDRLGCGWGRGHLNCPNDAESLTERPPRAWLGGRGERCRSDSRAHGSGWWFPNRKARSGGFARSRPGRC